MSDIFTIVLPVFGLIAVGYLGALIGLANDRMTDGLNDFLFVFATPVLLARLLIYSDFPAEIPIGYWLAFYTGMALCWVAAMVAARRVIGMSRGDSVIAGLAAGQSNTVMIGIPIIIKAYGESAAFPIAMLLAVNLPITMTAASILLANDARGSGSLKRLALHLVTHPILLGIAVGLALKFGGIRPEGPAKTMIDLLSSMAVPGALVGLGMAMKRYGLKDGLPIAGVVTILRLVIHPAITYLLAFHVFHLPPAWGGAAVLFACSPAGINVYIFAARYGQGQAIASTAIAVSTLLAAGSTAVWLRILGAG